MAVERLNIMLAIPKDIYDAIPIARKIAFRDEIRWLKERSVNINEGASNEEVTTIAEHHTCHHDEGGSHLPCEAVQEI